MKKNIKATQKKTQKKADSEPSFFQRHGKSVFRVFFVVVLIYCFWNAYRGISDAPLFDWDEARHGVSAWEMLERGDYLVQTYLWEVDYWNLKPPLAFWPIMLGYKLFGVNAFGMRFFSALSLPLCCAGAMLFINRYSGRIAALCTGLIFAAAGVQFNHLFLHGDADAVFFLSCFFSLLFFCMSFVEHDAFLAGAGFMAACAFLSKAAHAGILLIVLIAAFIILRGIKCFSFKSLSLFFCLPMTLPVLLWGFFRWRYDGVTFIEKMLLTDIIARSSSELEGNARGWKYYFAELSRVLGNVLLIVMIIILVACIVVYFVDKKHLKNQDRVMICVFSLMAIVPITLYSMSVTKLAWYVWPSCIGFFMLTGWIIGYMLNLYRSAAKEDSERYLSANLFSGIIIIFGLIVMPDRFTIQWFFDTSSLLPEESIFTFLPEEASLPREYSVIRPDGNPDTLPQSWVLHGIYEGYVQPAKTADTIDKEVYGEESFLILRFAEIAELENYLNEHPGYSLIVYSSTTAVIDTR